jgi:hypothetical protein
MANSHIAALERLRADYVDVRRHQVAHRLFPATQSGDEAQLRALEQRLIEIQRVLAAIDEALAEERAQAPATYESRGRLIE